MISWLFIGLVAAILLTPGPTNTLLASSGIQVGFRKLFALFLQKLSAISSQLHSGAF